MKRIPHPSGSQIIFDPKWHQYKIGHTSLKSVSKLLDKYFPFEEEKILKMVSRKTGESPEAIKAKWNRQALLGKNIHSYIESRLLDQPPPTFMLLMNNQKKRLSEQKNKKEETAEEKKKLDNLIKMESEILHGEEEQYIVAAEQAVQKVMANYYVLGVEEVIACPDWGIAGTIDFIGINKHNNNILIGDWKTSGSVVSNFRFGSFESPCTGCLSHLPNSKFYRYALQVFVYGEILKREKYFEKGFFDKGLQKVKQKAEEEQKLAASASSKKKKGKEVEKHPGFNLNLYHKDGNIVNMLEYGIVQLSKNESDEVAVEYKEVSSRTILPPDQHEMSFASLLQNVMNGI